MNYKNISKLAALKICQKPRERIAVFCYEPNKVYREVYKILEKGDQLNFRYFYEPALSIKDAHANGSAKFIPINDNIYKNILGCRFGVILWEGERIPKKHRNDIYPLLVGRANPLEKILGEIPQEWSGDFCDTELYFSEL